MEDLDALLAELEQSSRPAPKDCVPQVPSSCKQDPVAARPSAPCGQQPVASAALKAQLPPQAQPQREDLKAAYSPIPVPQPLLPSPPPTAAARQLDELLADLGHMQSKLVAVGQGAGVPAEPKSLLDNMLGSLTRDLQELGIAATPAGVCTACHKPISGRVLTALGKTWHPEHFTCAHCGQELGGQAFFERGGRAYCEDDYHQAFSPRCAYCAGPIREKVLTALDQTWHPEHFFCAHCGKVFGDDAFHEHSGKPYCRQDFLAMFAPKCQGCERPVTDNYLTALHGVWHPECFVCAVSAQRGPRGERVPEAVPAFPVFFHPGVPEWLRRWLLLRAGGSALLRAALPPAAGQHLPRLRPPGHRPLHHSCRAQVPPRALHLRLLPGAAAERHLPRARQQDVLPGLPRQALPLSPQHAATLPACLPGPSTVRLS
ncbi:leupaxin isoform X1 [Falco rusticolus]|uniref:leupaxin isoform X1 n=2 Tax=Falco rusticolus TaxID=120794 RepID=UPI001886A7D3|nr:leupaxin isoform X1 [Falco rusticolus]